MGNESRLEVRRETVKLLKEAGVMTASATSPSKFFAAITAAGLEVKSARVASYRITEGVLQTPLGELLKKAKALEVIFDWNSHRLSGGMSKAFLDGLDVKGESGKVEGVYFSGGPRSLFHPKLMLFELEAKSGHRLAVAVYGSANVTWSGLEENAELGTIEAWPSREDSPFFKQFDSWMKDAQPLLFEQLKYLPETEDELLEWEEPQGSGLVRLRPYQEEAVERIVSAAPARPPTNGWRGTLVVLPPAAGKTLTALTAACRVLQAQEGSSKRAPLGVWLTHSPMLARQAFLEFRRTGFLRRQAVGVLLHGQNAETSSGEYLSKQDLERVTGGWLGRRRVLVFVSKGKAANSIPKWIRGANVAVVDEAHHAEAPKWKKVLKDLRPRFVVGLTATPYRGKPLSDGTQRLLRKFDRGDQNWLEYFPKKRRVSLARERPEMAGHVVGYVAPVRNFYESSFTGSPNSVLSKPRFTTVAINNAKGEPVVASARNGSPPIKFFENPFEEGEYDADRWKEPKLILEALEKIDEDVCQRAVAGSRSGKVVLVIARSVAHADKLEAMIDGKVASLVKLHSKDGRSSRQRLRDLRVANREPGSVVVSVDMVSEGVDLPGVGLVVMPRWTASERLFWQLVGRGLRGPEAGGTEDVDIVTYSLQFDLPKTSWEIDVQAVDDEFVDAFGKYARHEHDKIVCKEGGAKHAKTSKQTHQTGRSTIDASGRVWTKLTTRSNPMNMGSIRRIDLAALGVTEVGVRVETKSGRVVYENESLKNPVAALRSQYKGGRKGPRYKFRLFAVE